MADRPIEFDAADLADAILGEPEAAPTPAAIVPRRPDFLGPILLMLLGVALTLAIGLALQFSADRTSPEPLRCDGLYASLDDDCCDDAWVENWAPCRLDCSEPNRDARQGATEGEGLFDAEERFADRPREC